MTSTQKLATCLCVAVCGVGGAGLAQAYPLVTLTPSFTEVWVGQSATVKITAEISLPQGADPADPTNTIVFHDVFLAYDPAVLQLQSFNWGDDALSILGFPADQQSGGDYTYVDAGFPQNSPPAWSLGAIGSALTSATGIDQDFYAGSVRLYQDASATAEQIYAAKPQDGSALFEAVFLINTSVVSRSSIVLIDSSYLTEPDFDWKVGADEIAALTVNTAEVQVPVPAPLALMAFGLFGLSGWRRLSRRV